MRYWQPSRLLAILAIGGGLFWPAQAPAQVFNNPGGISGGQNYGIDVCYYFGAYCGQHAADAFCERKNLGNATQFSFRFDTPPTWVRGDARWCRGATCDRFASITCGPRGSVFHTTYTFFNPFTRDYNDRPFGIDVCLNFGRNCGQPAADRYCRIEGYSSAVFFSIRHDTPPTWVIGDNRNCTGATCDRFDQVVCTR